MLRHTRSIYQPPTVRCSNPLDNASTAQTRARFPKSCPPVNIRESAEKLCRPIARQSYPTVPTIPLQPLSNHISSAGDGFETIYKYVSRGGNVTKLLQTLLR